MSLNTQLVLRGHLGVDTIVGKIRALPGVRDVTAAQRYRPQHWALNVTSDDGPAYIDLFLSSWAKDDHADIFDGESVFLSGPMEPIGTGLLAQLMQSEGGFIRRHEQAEWEVGPYLKDGI